jgi:hypothetical protein
MFNLSDAISVWGNMKESVRDRLYKKSNSKNVLSTTLDVSFITPTLLALGKINDNNIDELILTLQGQPAILWNLRFVDDSIYVNIFITYVVVESN